MNEYMLITAYPLFSSKSFHKTWDAVEEKIKDVLKLTEDYYELRGQEFSSEISYYSGEYSGIFVYKIWPEKPHIMKLVGKPKAYRNPEINETDGLDIDR